MTKLHSTTVKKARVVGKAGFEIRTLGYQAERLTAHSTTGTRAASVCMCVGEEWNQPNREMRRAPVRVPTYQGMTPTSQPTQ